MTDLPAKYKPKELRNRHVGVQNKTVYVIGFRTDSYGDSYSYGIFAGPTTNIAEILDVVPEHTNLKSQNYRDPYIIEKQPNGVVKELYKWCREQDEWHLVGANNDRTDKT